MSHSQDMANFYNARAKAFGLDPPREGRKTYGERYEETSRMSSSEIRETINRRGSGECGVAWQVLADRGE